MLLNSKKYRLDCEALNTYDTFGGLNKTEQRELLKKYRPDLGFANKPRRGRNQVMWQTLDHLKEFSIRGPLISLAAERMPETFVLWRYHIKSLALNVNSNKIAYDDLKEYNKLITKAYGYTTHSTTFDVKYGDLIDIMHTYRKKFAIIDADYMCQPTKEHIQDTILATQRCAADRSVLILAYSTPRRQGGDSVNERLYRPFMQEKLEDYFYILRRDSIDYRDSTPMRVDIFTLERKAA